jgi:hypothetical protein
MRSRSVLDGNRSKNDSVACSRRATVGCGRVALRVIMISVVIAAAANSSDWP